MQAKSSWWLINQRRFVFPLLVLSAVFTTLSQVNDTHIAHNLISSEDKLLVASCYLIIGGIVGLLINMVFSMTRLGKVIDPEFQKLTIPGTKTLLYALASGSVSALSTLFFLWGSSLYDPGIVSALAGATVLFIMLWELYKGRIRFSDYIVPALLVFIGGALATSQVGRGLQISVLGIAILLFGKNILGAAGSLLEKEAVVLDNATNVTFWRFLFLTLSGVILAILLAVFRGNLTNLGQLIQDSFWQMLPFVLITMVFVYFSNGFQAASKKYLPVTTVTVVGSLPIVMGLFLGLAVNLFWPNTFTDLPQDIPTIVVRVVGSCIIVAGVGMLKELRVKSPEDSA